MRHKPWCEKAGDGQIEGGDLDPCTSPPVEQSHAFAYSRQGQDAPAPKVAVYAPAGTVLTLDDFVAWCTACLQLAAAAGAVPPGPRPGADRT